jgi:phage protein D
MRPTFTISAAGNDITGDVTARLISMDITDTVDETSDGLTMVLEDVLGTLELPKSGAKLEVTLGYDGVNQRMGAFVVDEVTVEGPPDTIAITASSTPFVDDRGGGGAASFTSRKSRSWEGKTIDAIVKTIASECGLNPVVDKTLASITVPHIAQVGESDANLLVRIARRYAGVLKPADGRLVLAADQGGQTTSGAALELTLTPADVTTYRIRYGGKGQGVTKVRARVRNYQTGTDDEIEAEVEGAQF